MVMDEVFEEDATKDLFSPKPEGRPGSMTCLLTSNFQRRLGAIFWDEKVKFTKNGQNDER
jgi:hypothetical protein